MTSIVSVKVPIWFGFTSMAFAAFDFIPVKSRSLLVTNKSSPTIWISLLKILVKSLQEFQSSSEKGSSIDLIGYFLIKSK